MIEEREREVIALGEPLDSEVIATFGDIPINALADEAAELLQRCREDTQVFAKVFFPDLFYSPFSKLHHEIFEAIDSGEQLIAIAAPRGLGKTTIARTLASKKILFGDRHFLPYVSNSATVAEMQTENIKRELLRNRAVRAFFGSIKESLVDLPMEESFSKMSWVAFGKTFVFPRGAGQQIRGVLWDRYRPDLFIVDDLENKDEIINKDIRDKLKEWFESDLMKAIPQYTRDYQIIYIDTIKHEDCLLEDLMTSPRWTSIRQSICVYVPATNSYKSNDPNYITDQELEIEVADARRRGLLDAFYRERMNLPIAAEDASFQKEDFQYYKPEQFLRASLVMEKFVIVDPAKTVKMQSADSAIVGIGVDYSNNPGLYVIDVNSDKMFPDQLYANAFAMADQIGTYVIAVEVTSLEEFIKQPFQNEAKRLGRPYQFIWLRARGGTAEEKGKAQRVSALVPYYRNRLVWHHPTRCAKLEEQLLGFPRSKLWDIMDATSYIVELLEMGNRYLLPKAPGPNEEMADDPEAEFAELEYEDAISDWGMRV